MGIVRAVCTSKAKGTQKRPEPFVRCLVNWGIEGDAHGGPWHRQVSLLSLEKIEAFRRRGAPVSYGDFGENIADLFSQGAEGIDVSARCFALSAVATEIEDYFDDWMKENPHL